MSEGKLGSECGEVDVTEGEGFLLTWLFPVRKPGGVCLGAEMERSGETEKRILLSW